MTCAGGDAVAANGRLGGDAEVAEEAGGVCLLYCPGAPPLGTVEFQILYHFLGSFLDHR